MGSTDAGRPAAAAQLACKSTDTRGKATRAARLRATRNHTAWTAESDERMRRAALVLSRSVFAQTLSHLLFDFASNLSSTLSMYLSIRPPPPSPLCPLPDMLGPAVAPGRRRAAQNAPGRGASCGAPPRGAANANAIKRGCTRAAPAARGGTPAAPRSSPPAGDSSSAAHTAGNTPR